MWFASGVLVPEQTLEASDEHRVLATIEARADLPRHLRPETAAAVTMCTLADRLTPGQGHLLFDALPPPIARLFESCRIRWGQVVARLDDAGFLEQLAQLFCVTPAHAELIADAVFRAITPMLPDEVVRHVTAQLPRDLRDLWRGERPIIGVVTASEDAVHLEVLAEIAERLPLPVGVSAPDALTAVMCAFTQRLSRGEARDVWLGLPHPVRQLLDGCIERGDERAEVFDRTQLATRIAAELGTTPALADQIVRVVLTAIKRILPVKEQADITSQLPMDLRAVWQAA